MPNAHTDIANISRIKAYISAEGLSCGVLTVASGWRTHAGLYGDDAEDVAIALGGSVSRLRGDGATRRTAIMVRFNH